MFEKFRFYIEGNFLFSELYLQRYLFLMEINDFHVNLSGTPPC